jgi:hypothetical protein
MAFKQLSQNTVGGNPIKDNRGLTRYFKILEDSLSGAVNRGSMVGSYNPDLILDPKNVQKVLDNGNGLIDLTPSGRFGVHDMYNGCLMMDVAMDVNIKIGTANVGANTDIFIGLKNSFGIFERYEYANNNDIMMVSQNNCYAVSNIIDLVISEDAKKQNYMNYHQLLYKEARKSGDAEL